MATNQLGLFIIYFFSGIMICIVFDFFRSLRKSIKTSNIVTYIEDVLFWIITGIFIIFLISKYSYGELRLYIPIGMIVGGTLYYLTISRYLVKSIVSIITFNKKIILFLIAFTLKFLGKPINFFIINLKKLSKT